MKTKTKNIRIHLLSVMALCAALFLSGCVGQYFENVGKAFINAASMLDLTLTPRMIEVTSGNGADPDPETIAMMQKHNIVIGATLFSLTHCAAMTAARENFGIRGCTLPGITDDLFARSMQVSPKTLQADGLRWKERLAGVRRIRIVKPGRCR